MNTVIIKKCKEYDAEKIKEQVLAGLDEAGGLDSIIKPGEKVLLKVNSLTQAPPETAVNTHPEFLRAIIRIIKTKTDRVFVGDSPAFTLRFSFASRGNKMGKVIREEGAELVDFTESQGVVNESALAYKNLEISSLVKSMDKVISLPKLKTHTLTYMTLAVKNMYGIVPGGAKVGFHLKAGRDRELFSKTVIDIYNTRPPDFTIMDGIYGLEGNGPSSDGDPVNTGVIVMGKDGFGIDHAVCRITGVDPDKVTTLSVYRKFVLKGGEIEYIIKGEEIEGVFHKIKTPGEDVKSSIPGFLYNFAKDLFVRKPLFRKRRCTGCLACVKHCPVNALKYKKRRKIVCDYKACIRCFVCLEVCEDKAVTVSRPLFSLFK